MWLLLSQFEDQKLSWTKYVDEHAKDNNEDEQVDDEVI